MRAVSETGDFRITYAFLVIVTTFTTMKFVAPFDNKITIFRVVGSVYAAERCNEAITSFGTDLDST